MNIVPTIMSHGSTWMFISNLEKSLDPKAKIEAYTV